MKNFYHSYIRAFHKYASSCFEDKFVKSLTSFAVLINFRANNLIARAKLNGRLDLNKLQREINEVGKLYIKKFMARLHRETKQQTKIKEPQ